MNNLHQKGANSVVCSEPLYCEKMRKFQGLLKVSVDAGLERLKVICSWEDGRGMRIQPLEVIGII